MPDCAWVMATLDLRLFCFDMVEMELAIGSRVRVKLCSRIGRPVEQARGAGGIWQNWSLYVAAL